MQIYEFDKIKDHIWHIQPCSAQTGEGLVTGMKWLSDQLVFKSNNNFPVNPYADFSEEKNTNKKKEVKKSQIKNQNNKNPNIGQSLNNTDSNVGTNTSNQNTINNINSSVGGNL